MALDSPGAGRGRSRVRTLASGYGWALVGERCRALGWRRWSGLPREIVDGKMCSNSTLIFNVIAFWSNLLCDKTAQNKLGYISFSKIEINIPPNLKYFG